MKSVEINLTHARENQDGGFFELTVNNKRQAQFLCSRLGYMPIDWHGLVTINDTGTYIYMRTLTMSGELQVWTGERSEKDGDEIITLRAVDYLFTDGGKGESQGPDYCGD